MSWLGSQLGSGALLLNINTFLQNINIKQAHSWSGWVNRKTRLQDNHGCCSVTKLHTTLCPTLSHANRFSVWWRLLSGSQTFFLLQCQMMKAGRELSGASLCCCSVTRLCPTLCGPTDYSTAGSLVFHYPLEFAQIHVHCVGDAIQPSHPLLPSSPFAFNLSQNQGLFQWVNSLY